MRFTVQMPPPLSLCARTATSSAIRDLLKLTEQSGILSLAGGLPSPITFPVAELRAEAAKLFDDSNPRRWQALQYGRTEGVADLRELLAARSATDPETTIITTGSQQALDLISRSMIDPGSIIVVESPTYVGALQAMRAYQPAFEPVPGDALGLDTDALELRLREGLRPVACYVVSNFANPTGATLPIGRREHLLRLAQEFDFLIIEDDPYGDLRFRGLPVAAIRSLPGAAEHVALVRTVSKTLMPGLRLGWASVPSWLFDSMVVAKQGVDLHTSTLSQYLALGMLADGDAHAVRVRHSAALYARQAESLQAALAQHLGDRMDIVPIEGGMFLWARLHDEAVDTTDLLRVALERGVAFVPGAAFFVSRPDSGDLVPTSYLRMSFATLAPEQFDEAARRLASAMDG